MNITQHDEHALRCPECGDGEHLHVEFVALVSIALAAGAPQRVTTGGVLDGLPERMACGNCGVDTDLDPVIHTGLLESVASTIDAALPSHVRAGLSDGAVVWEAGS